MEALQLNLFEEWKPLPGNEKYLISTEGRCMTVGRMIQSKAGWQRYREGRLLVKHDNGHGYFAYLIDGKHRYIHRLVALTFIPNPENKEQVDHIDGNKANNCVDNLRWATRSENLMNPVTHPRMIEAQEKKTIVMLDADGNYVCECEGIAELCRRLGVTTGGVKGCLHKKGTVKSIQGFQYVYKDDYNPQTDYQLLLSHNMGYDYVFNERIVVVFSDNKIYDVFSSTYTAETFFNIPRKYIFDICNKHVPICKKHQIKLPNKCEMYFYKDLKGNLKEEVRQFYRNKYPIPKII